MPYFDFSLPKKQTAKKRGNNTTSYNVVVKAVNGIVWINVEADYFVDVEGKLYKIHKDNYSCKGKDKVYHQCQLNNRVCYIRTKDNLVECSKHWLPFAPGCIVFGNIVRIGFTEYFDIKKIWTDPDNSAAHDAIDFYNKHLNEIKVNYKNKHGS